MDSKLKDWLKNNPDKCELFLNYIDQGKLYEAYSVLRVEHPLSIITDLFTEVQAIEEPSPYYYYTTNLYWEGNTVEVNKGQWWEHENDIVLTATFSDYIELFKSKSLIFNSTYRNTHIYRISNDTCDVSSCGKYFKLAASVPDIESKISTFDEEGLVEAIRTMLNYWWKTSTKDMYDGPVNRNDYEIKLVQIHVDKDKKTRNWYATVKYRIAPTISSAEPYIMYDGKTTDTITIDLPMNKKLNKYTLINPTKDISTSFTGTQKWVKLSTYNKRKEESNRSAKIKTELDNIENLIITAFPQHVIECYTSSYGSCCVKIQKIDNVLLMYELDINKADVTLYYDPDADTDETIKSKLDELINNVKETILPLVKDHKRKLQNKSDRKEYIENTIKEVTDELKNILVDLRSYYRNDTDVKFVSDRLTSSVNYTLKDEDGNIPFDKTTFETETIIKDIMAKIKPDKTRIAGRSPLILHLNEKKKQ